MGAEIKVDNRRESLKNLIGDISLTLGHVTSTAVDSQSGMTKSLIYTMTKTIIGLVMTFARKELAHAPEVSQILVSTEYPPPQRLIAGLMHLTMEWLDIMDNDTIHMVEGEMEGIRQRLNKWAESREGQ